ncbi:hypothetical protein [uncultured Jatrophihabitans sp.]|uniref:hypothetical protein n=1 Tax=uncultured Jatrophihabitans sp. TaxID=1610747 RepID=UPI0035CB6585
MSAGPEAHPALLRNGYRFELLKLLSQWRIRIVFLACLIAPGGFVAVVGQQSSLPADTVFGRWMHETGWAGPLVALFAVSVAVVAATTSASSSGVERAKVDRSLATAYAHIYRLQTRELHRPDVTEAQLRTSASCDKGGAPVADSGPGNDWRCVVHWHIPGATVTGYAIYQLDINPDGRYVADGDGPVSVNGFFQVHTPHGDTPNPLWQFDGLVDLLDTPPKG